MENKTKPISCKYYTVDTKEPAPRPNMTGKELHIMTDDNSFIEELTWLERVSIIIIVVACFGVFVFTLKQIINAL